jgi:hypothetical protein
MQQILDPRRHCLDDLISKEAFREFMYKDGISIMLLRFQGQTRRPE